MSSYKKFLTLVMRKRPLLNLILFLCLILLGPSLVLETLFAVDSNCFQIRGRSSLSGGNVMLDFTRLNFESKLTNLSHRACVRPVGVGSYVLDGWVWNNQLGWVSTRAVSDPNNPANKLNSDVSITSAYEYGVDIIKEERPGGPVANLTGYMWGDNIGWIKMNCLANDRFAYDVNHCGSQQYGVSVDFNSPVGKDFPNYFYLTGHAWNEHYGYIKFDDVAVHVPEVNFDFRPEVEVFDSDLKNYANGERTDQQIIVRMFDPNDRNVTDVFFGSDFSFCLIFDDQRGFSSEQLVSNFEFSLANNGCLTHAEFNLNRYDSRTAFEYNSVLKAMILKSAFYPKSFVTSAHGDLILAGLELANPDPDVPSVKVPIQNQKLYFESPVEVVLVPKRLLGDNTNPTADEIFAKETDEIEFNYGPDNQSEDYFFVSRFHRGKLLEGSLSHKFNLSFSDEDLVDVSMVLTLPDLNSESSGETVEAEVDVPEPGGPRYRPLYALGGMYDIADEDENSEYDDLIVPVEITLEKLNEAIPNSILATNIFVESTYAFDFISQDESANEESVEVESDRVRTVEFETFETFTKGFVQDRAFNSIFDESKEVGASNYALFRAKLNQIMQTSDIRRCIYSQLRSGACNNVEPNEIILIDRQNTDPELLDLNELHDFLKPLNATPFVVITSGFDFYLGDDFEMSDFGKFGLVALQNDDSQGGRFMLDTSVNNIINTFLYLDKNLMSVDSLAKAELVSVEDNSSVAGIPSFAKEDSYNQLVFSGQLISNNCTGCSRGSNERPAQRADGRLVLNDEPEELIKAQLDDINFVRYSPLVFNLDREENNLFELNCDDQQISQRPIDMFDYFSNFTLDKMCYAPEKLGLNISKSDYLEGVEANKLRSFMMFYQDPGDLPVFGSR